MMSSLTLQPRADAVRLSVFSVIDVVSSSSTRLRAARLVPSALASWDLVTLRRFIWRAMAAALLISACFVGGVLGVVGLKVNQVKHSYRLEQLRLVRGQLEEVNRQLGVELATLRALARIESKARGELGMLPPSRDQVRMAREYVPGTSGTASLRTAREESPAPPGPRAR